MIPAKRGAGETHVKIGLETARLIEENGLKLDKVINAYVSHLRTTSQRPR